MSKKMVGIIGAAALTSALFVGVPAGLLPLSLLVQVLNPAADSGARFRYLTVLLRHMKLFLMKVAHGSTVPTR